MIISDVKSYLLYTLWITQETGWFLWSLLREQIKQTEINKITECCFYNEMLCNAFTQYRNSSWLKKTKCARRFLLSELCSFLVPWACPNESEITSDLHDISINEWICIMDVRQWISEQPQAYICTQSVLLHRSPF